MQQEQAIVTVIVPSWQRPDLLHLCLQSVAEQSEQRLRLIVVSNGASRAVDAVAREFSASIDCRVISLSRNRGFAGGVNAGLAAAGTKYIAVLNDDVRLEHDWLRTLTGWLDAHPDTALCCGTVLSGDGTRVDNLGDAVARSGAAWRIGFGLPVAKAGEQTPRTILASSWTAVVMRRDAIERIGNLDERFISYLEDIDFAVRCVRVNARVDLLPAAVCWHLGGASSGGPMSPLVVRQMTRNQLLLLAKNLPTSVLFGNLMSIAWGQALWMLMAVRKGRLVSWLMGICSFAVNLPGALASRRGWNADATLRLRQWLSEAESAIYADQMSAARGKPDTYWRWYFALVGAPGGKFGTGAQPAAPEDSRLPHD